MLNSNSISLIICSFGPRVKALDKLVDSLIHLNEPHLQCIIVDQNDDNRLYECVNKLNQHVSVKHLRCRPGLSRARNLGLLHAQGRIVGFPDDDCWYESDTLIQAMNAIERNLTASVVTGKIIDECGKPYIHNRWPKAIQSVSLKDAIKYVASSAMFLDRELIENQGGFDEEMGVGATYGSCEEIELVRRLITSGVKVIYDPSIRVRHPQYQSNRNVLSSLKSYQYGLGFGYLLGKEKLGVVAFSRYLIAPLLGALYKWSFGNNQEARSKIASARGRLEGWLAGREKGASLEAANQ